MGGGGGDERFEPAWLREGVGIEQGDKLGLGHGKAPVGAGGKTDVGFQPLDRGPSDEPGPRSDQVLAGCQRAVAAGIVHQHDPLGQYGLSRQALQTPDDVGSAVEVDDHQGHTRRCDR